MQTQLLDANPFEGSDYDEEEEVRIHHPKAVIIWKEQNQKLFVGGNIVGRKNEGNENNNDVEFDHHSVSDKHAEIIVDSASNATSVIVRDLNSRNGTYVEKAKGSGDFGKKIGKGVVKIVGEGCRIRFGAVECLFSMNHSMPSIAEVNSNNNEDETYEQEAIDEYEPPNINHSKLNDLNLTNHNNHNNNDNNNSVEVPTQIIDDAFIAAHSINNTNKNSARLYDATQRMPEDLLKFNEDDNDEDESGNDDNRSNPYYKTPNLVNRGALGMETQAFDLSKAKLSDNEEDDDVTKSPVPIMIMSTKTDRTASDSSDHSDHDDKIIQKSIKTLSNTAIDDDDETASESDYIVTSNKQSNTTKISHFLNDSTNQDDTDVDENIDNSKNNNATSVTNSLQHINHSDMLDPVNKNNHYENNDDDDVDSVESADLLMVPNEIKASVSDDNDDEAVAISGAVNDEIPPSDHDDNIIEKETVLAPNSTNSSIKAPVEINIPQVDELNEQNKMEVDEPIKIIEEKIIAPSPQILIKSNIASNNSLLVTEDIIVDLNSAQFTSNGSEHNKEVINDNKKVKKGKSSKFVTATNIISNDVIESPPKVKVTEPVKGRKAKTKRADIEEEIELNIQETSNIIISTNDTSASLPSNNEKKARATKSAAIEVNIDNNISDLAVPRATKKKKIETDNSKNEMKSNNKVEIDPILILFTKVLPDKKLLKKIKNVQVTEDATIATHCVTLADLKRSPKLLIAINSKVKYIVTEEWLEESAKVGYSVDESKYIIKDNTNEKIWKFKLSDTLLNPHRGAVFIRVGFVVTDDVFGKGAPPEDEFQSIVESGGGKLLTISDIISSKTSSLLLESIEKLYVISSPTALTGFSKANLNKIRKVLENPVTVGLYSMELVLLAVLRQQIDQNSDKLILPS
eukprot:gene10729-14413_t